MLFSLLYSRKQFSTGRCSPVSAEVPSGDSGAVYMPAYRRLQHYRHHPFDDAAGHAALAFCFTLKRSAGLNPRFSITLPLSYALKSGKDSNLRHMGFSENSVLRQ